jgi:hypothetical protein
MTVHLASVYMYFDMRGKPLSLVIEPRILHSTHIVHYLPVDLMTKSLFHDEMAYPHIGIST